MARVTAPARSRLSPGPLRRQPRAARRRRARKARVARRRPQRIHDRRPEPFRPVFEPLRPAFSRPISRRFVLGHASSDHRAFSRDRRSLAAPAGGDVVAVRDRFAPRGPILPAGDGTVTEHPGPQGLGAHTAPAGVSAYNPALDVAPAALIDSIITERGVIRPVNAETSQAVPAPDRDA